MTAGIKLAKKNDLCTLSAFTLEEHEYVNDLPKNGRADLLAAARNQPGGMEFFGLEAVRAFDQQASLGIAVPCGDLDQGIVRRSLWALRAELLILASPASFTNNSRVTMTARGERQIVRLSQGVGLDSLTELDRRRIREQHSDSRACLLGNFDAELTHELIENAKNTGAYVGLCPGAKQYSRLHMLKPHATFLNLDEAREVTHSHVGNSELVFDKLLAASAAEDLLVMTDGPNAAYIAHRRSGSRCKLTPPDLPPLQNGWLFSLGCGDVFAGTVTYLLGQLRRPASTYLVRLAVEFAQDVVAVHMTANQAARERLLSRYKEIRPLFYIDESEKLAFKGNEAA